MLQNRRRGQPAGGQGRRSGALVPCLPPRCMYAQGPPPLNQKPAEQSARPPGEEQGPPLQQRQRHACALPPRASAPGGNGYCRLCRTPHTSPLTLLWGRSVSTLAASTYRFDASAAGNRPQQPPQRQQMPASRVCRCQPGPAARSRGPCAPPH